jgi:gliding motility-associated-like protein
MCNTFRRSLSFPLLAFLLVCITTPALYAQYTAAPVWLFGHHAGINFNSGSAVPISSPMETHGAKSAIQCDAAGDVMFSSNGMRIWDKLGNEMPGSENPLWPSVDFWKLNSIIVPDLGNVNRYFVFNSFPSDGNPPYGPSGTSTLTYTVVDMTLNGGLGGVVPGQGNVVLDIFASDQMTVVPDDQCGYWLISSRGTIHVFGFRAFHITGTGINTTPVLSPFASMPSSLPSFPFGVDNRYGNMVYSHTRHKLFMSYAGGDLYAYSFDPASGVVSNAQQIGYAYAPVFPVSSSTPGICLSPDEQLLYTAGYIDGSTFELRQHPIVTAGANVSLGPYNVIFSPGPLSPYAMIDQPWGFNYWETDMQIAHDNRIYLTYTMGKRYVGCIEQPNQAGTACNYVPHAVTFLPNTYSASFLPSPTIPRFNGNIVAGSGTDIRKCFQSSVLLTAPDQAYTNYTWQDGSTGKQLNATASGRYILRSDNGPCGDARMDTFNVTLINFTVDLGKDTLICKGTGFDLDVSVAVPGATYLWHDGSTSAIRSHITEPGTYSVTVQKEECKASDSKVVNVEVCNCGVGMPTAFSPNADGRNDKLLPVITPGCPMQQYSLSIYNRYGQRVFYSSNPASGWDGTFNGSPADVGTYMYYLEYSFRNSTSGSDKQQRKGDVTLLY